MGARHFLLVCVLGAVGVQAAAASEADARDINALQRPSADAAGSHDGSGSGSDVLGVPHSSGAPSQAAPSSSSSSENCPTDGSSGTQHSRRVNLGWQSLLPGSIQ